MLNLNDPTAWELIYFFAGFKLPRGSDVSGRETSDTMLLDSWAISTTNFSKQIFVEKSAEYLEDGSDF